MDLTVEDVAELLELPEHLVTQWSQEGLLPAYRLEEQYRFSRIEIEDWLLKHRGENGTTSSKGSSQFCLYRALHQAEVLGVLPGTSKEELLRLASLLIGPKLEVDAEMLTELLLDREQMMPTGFGSGIAIPHTRELFAKSPVDRLFVVYPEKPLEYGSLDGQPVHTLFFLFASTDKRHLQLLAKLSHLTVTAQAVSFLQTRPPKKELLDFVFSWEGNL